MATWVDLDDDEVVYCGNRGEYENYNIPPEMVEHPADVVPVVRCKYCVHYKEENGFHNIKFMVCTVSALNHPMRMEGDFCSRGERKTDGAAN